MKDSFFRNRDRGQWASMKEIRWMAVQLYTKLQSNFLFLQRFKHLETKNIEFQQIAMHRTDLHKSEDVLNRLMIKDNIAVIVLLENKENGNKLIVSNAHLHWDPLFSDVKVIQTALLIDEVQRCATSWAKQYNTASIPVLVSGDFNSLPDSGVVEFLSKGSISTTHKELQQYNYQPFTDRGLEHSLNLKSAYSLVDDIDFTNFTPLFKGIIDYIWYDTSALITTGLLGGVDKQYASTSVGFPNPHHPSDHIPLVVSMKFKAANNSQRHKVNFNNK
jgi:CCR4-NOT transcription complex subunit 6